jgi:tetratricopeptide (TPR) repeat protein
MMMRRLGVSIVSVLVCVLLGLCASAQEQSDPKYTSAEEAFRVGVAFHHSRNFAASRGPLEAALEMADDNAFRIKVYEALLPAYREIPELEPYQTAAEFIIANSDQSAKRSLTRRAYLSFAYNRGQMNNLINRYEDRLVKDRDDYTAVFILAELYSATRTKPERAIGLLKQLEQMDTARPAEATGRSPDQISKKIVIEKGNLARQYVQAKQYQQAAELYTEIAPLDPSTEAWNLKEAASAWLKLGNHKEALAAAMRAGKAPPEARNDQLTHFFHKGLGDIFVKLSEHAKAIPHYEIAVGKTTIDGYVKATQAALDEARRKAK